MTTRAELGRHLDIRERRVHELLRIGVLPDPGPEGELDVDACAIAYIRYLRQLKEEREATRLIDDARERLTRAQADLAEMEVRVRKEQLVRLPVVSAYWQSMVTSMRSRLLTVPTRTAAAIATAATHESVLATLAALVHDALAELAGDAIPEEVRARFTEAAEAKAKASRGSPQPRSRARKGNRQRKN